MITTNKAIAGLVFITLMNGFVSVNMFTNQSTFYSNEVDKLLIENDKLHNDLSEFYKFGVEVDVTMYQPTHYQTDSTPNITADGTKFRIKRHQITNMWHYLVIF